MNGAAEGLPTIHSTWEVAVKFTCLALGIDCRCPATRMMSSSILGHLEVFQHRADKVVALPFLAFLP